jgi:hypothetical protein
MTLEGLSDERVMGDVVEEKGVDDEDSAPEWEFGWRGATRVVLVHQC